jgi:hypothetical protein
MAQAYIKLNVFTCWMTIDNEDGSFVRPPSRERLLKTIYAVDVSVFIGICCLKVSIESVARW